MHLKAILTTLINKISDFMDTIWFAVTMTAIELMSYYFGLDLLIILCVSFFLSFSLVFKKNLCCLLTLFLYMSSMVSLKNSPGNLENQSGFYFQPLNYILCIIAAAIPISIVVYLAISNLVKRKIKINSFLISTLILGVVFLTNGIFSDLYSFLDIVFGFFMFFFFVILLIGILPRVWIDEGSLKNISKQVGIYCLVIIVELVCFYVTFFSDGNKIDSRLIIFLGWGNRNTIGMLLCVCLGFLFYLVKFEKKSKIKIFAIIVFILSFIGVIVSFSRQAYVSIAALITFYFLYGILKKREKERLRFVIYFSLWCILGISFVIVCFYLGYFSVLTKENINSISDGRIRLWKEALSAFANYPIFGRGFYFLGGDPKVQLDNVMPLCCHNTILEMLGACGIIGLIAYIFYRVMSIKEIVNNFFKEKICAISGLFVMLLMSLLDIHIFDLLGTCIYVILLAMCISKKQSTLHSTDEIFNKDKRGKNYD